MTTMAIMTTMSLSSIPFSIKTPPKMTKKKH